MKSALRYLFLTACLIPIESAWAESILYISHGNIYSVNPRTTFARVIVECPPQNQISSILPLPQSKRLLYALQEINKDSASSVWIANLDGKNSRKLMDYGPGRISLDDHSPDEKAIVYTALRNDSFSIIHLKLDGSQPRRKRGGFSPCFINDTTVAFLGLPAVEGFCYHQILKWYPDAGDLDTLSNRPDLCLRILSSMPRWKKLAVVGSDSFTGMREFIDVLNVDGEILNSGVAQSIGLIRFLDKPRFSPDGNSLLWCFEHWLNLADLTTGQSKRLAEKLDPDYFRWSPDGKLIAYTGQRQNDWSEIHLIDADGKHKRRLTQSRAREFQLYWIK